MLNEGADEEGAGIDTVGFTPPGNRLTTLTTFTVKNVPVKYGPDESE